MKQILFPTNHTSSSTHTGPKWISMDPLKFAEYMAQMAGPQPCSNLSKRRGASSLKISTSSLAEKSPPVPECPRNAVIGAVPCHIVSKLDEDLSGSKFTGTEMPPLIKKRASHGMFPALVPSDEDVDDTLTSFRPSFLLPHNPNEQTAKLAVNELTVLSQKFESMPKYNECLSSYKRFRDGLYESSKTIYNNHHPMAEKNLEFSQMYSAYIQHMKALIAMAQKFQDEERPKQDVVPENVENIDSDGSESYGTRPIFRRVYSKKSFTGFMTQWLVENWTNPYPDDEGLAELAELNGTTHTIVSNWLINARTRKWRPAIVKAFDAGRPSDMLQEDSICVFKGKPLRKL